MLRSCTVTSPSGNGEVKSLQEKSNQKEVVHLGQGGEGPSPRKWWTVWAGMISDKLVVPAKHSYSRMGTVAREEEADHPGKRVLNTLSRKFAGQWRGRSTDQWKRKLVPSQWKPKKSRPRGSIGTSRYTSLRMNIAYCYPCALVDQGQNQGY